VRPTFLCLHHKSSLPKPSVCPPQHILPTVTPQTLANQKNVQVIQKLWITYYPKYLQSVVTPNLCNRLLPQIYAIGCYPKSLQSAVTPNLCNQLLPQISSISCYPKSLQSVANPHHLFAFPSSTAPSSHIQKSSCEFLPDEHFEHLNNCHRLHLTGNAMFYFCVHL
jgi:hypothetical protein